MADGAAMGVKGSMLIRLRPLVRLGSVMCNLWLHIAVRGC
jgi:hypothetical protein